VRALSDWLTNFTFSKGVTFRSPKEYQHIIPALLQKIWAKDNQKQQILWEIGNQGSIQGDAFVKVAYEPEFEDAVGVVHPGKVRILPLNASFCFPEWHPHDRDRMIRFKLKYRFWGCQSTDSEVLTTQGWKVYSDLAEGDLILTLNQETDEIQWKPVSAVNIYDYPGHMIQWDTHVPAISTPNHRWLIEREDGSRDIARTELAIEGDSAIPSLPKGTKILVGGGVPSQFPFERIYDDELVETAAWYITEGWDHYNQQNCHSIYLAQKKEPFVTDIRRLMAYWKSNGATFNEYSPNKEGVISWYLGKGVKNQLEKLVPEKKITPEFLMSLTYQQLLLLRKVLLDGDGCRTRNSVRWTQLDINRQDSYQMLCAMIGIRTAKTTCGEKIQEYSRRHILTDTVNKHSRRVNLADGKIWCPTVENGIWMCRRAGSTFWTGNTAPEGTRQVYTYVEIITDDTIEEYVNDELIDRRPNPLGIIPVVHIANRIASASPWGLSDITDVIPLNREYNEKATDISDIVNYYTAPVTILTGAKASNLERGANKIWALTQKDAHVENLTGGSEGLPQALEYLQMVKIGMHEMIGIPENSLGMAQPISNTSGVALAIQYMPTMMAYDQKRTQYEVGLKRISKLALQTLFHFEPENLVYDPQTEGIQEEADQPTVLDPADPEIYDLSVVWPPPLPVDQTIQLSEIQVKQSMGLESKVGALRELGEEFPDEKLAELFDERVVDMEQDAAMQVRKAIIAAIIQKYTGLVPEGYAEEQPPPSPNADGAMPPSPPPTPVDNMSLPDLPSIGDITGLGGTNMLSNVTTMAFGTKLPQRRLINNTDNS
jgi:Phage portal protein, SPP1 Gp6-like